MLPILAKQCGAEVFLLSVLTDTGTLLLSEVTLAGATVQMEVDFRKILDEGVARLKGLGFDPVAELVRGQPAEEIGKFARQVGADLIVVGHRRQSAFDRWWSGPKGAYLMDYTDCSLLVARNAVSDEAIQALRVLSESGPSSAVALVPVTNHDPRWHSVTQGSPGSPAGHGGAFHSARSPLLIAELAVLNVGNDLQCIDNFGSSGLDWPARRSIRPCAC